MSNSELEPFISLPRKAKPEDVPHAVSLGLRDADSGVLFPGLLDLDTLIDHSPQWLLAEEMKSFYLLLRLNSPVVWESLIEKQPDIVKFNLENYEEPPARTAQLLAGQNIAYISAITYFGTAAVVGEKYQDVIDIEARKLPPYSAGLQAARDFQAPAESKRVYQTRLQRLFPEDRMLQPQSAMKYLIDNNSFKGHGLTCPATSLTANIFRAFGTAINNGLLYS